MGFEFKFEKFIFLIIINYYFISFLENVGCCIFIGVLELGVFCVSMYLIYEEGSMLVCKWVLEVCFYFFLDVVGEGKEVKGKVKCKGL